MASLPNKPESTPTKLPEPKHDSAAVEAGGGRGVSDIPADRRRAAMQMLADTQMKSNQP